MLLRSHEIQPRRRGNALATVLSASLDYEQFKEALRLVGLELDEKGQLVRENNRDDSADSIRAKARVLATQPTQRQFRERAIELLEQLGRRGALAARGYPLGPERAGVDIAVGVAVL